MILYVGGPAVAGRWKWSPAGANVVSVPTTFTSSSWDTRDRWETDPEIGEQRSSVEWTRPQPLNPRYLGLAPCGSAEILSGGATAADVGTPLTDDQGVPECCNALEWVGGMEAGGEPDGWPRDVVGGCTGVSFQLRVTVRDLPGGSYFPPGGLEGRLIRQWPLAEYTGMLTPADGFPVHVSWAPSIFPLSVLAVWRDGDTPPIPSATGYACGPLTTGDVAYADAPSYPLGILVNITDTGPPEEWTVKPLTQVNFESQKQATDARGRIGGSEFGVPYSLGLYQGDQLLPATLTMTGITEASFPGYARISLSMAGTQTLTMGRVYLVQYPVQVFTCTGAASQQIGGWFIASVTGAPRLRWIRPFGSGPVLVGSAGQTIPVLPQITFQSQFSD